MRWLLRWLLRLHSCWRWLCTGGGQSSLLPLQVLLHSGRLLGLLCERLCSGCSQSGLLALQVLLHSWRWLGLGCEGLHALQLLQHCRRQGLWGSLGSALGCGCLRILQVVVVILLLCDVRWLPVQQVYGLRLCLPPVRCCCMLRCIRATICFAVLQPEGTPKVTWAPPLAAHKVGSLTWRAQQQACLAAD